MKVLVVGGSGFIGRALTHRLLEAGHAVEAWDRTPRGIPGVASRTVDLLGTEPLPAPEGGTWDAALHLAANSVPGLAWTSDLALANLRMTARVFDHLALHAPGCRAIFASSAHVYAPSGVPLRETDPLGSGHPYAISKQLGEVWAQGCRNQLQVRIVRPFNLLGPGMAEGLLVPDLLRLIRGGARPILMKGRDDLRDFLDWRDAVEAYLALIHLEAPSGIVLNLCSGRPTRVSALVEALLRAHGLESEVQFADPRCGSLVGDPARLMEWTGWSPRRSLEETAAAIVAES